MFLKKKGFSGKYSFDIIYSAIQKFMRRNELDNALEICKEFQEYPNVLKKRLIYCSVEDCPDMNLINDIFNTEPKIEKLIPYVKIICNHIKCREVFYAFYYCAAKEPLNKEELNIKDDLLTTMRKLVYLVLENKYEHIISFYQQYYKNMELKKIFKFINQNRCFIYALAAKFVCPYIQEKYELDNDIKFDLNFKEDFVLPDYVFDKHTLHGKDKSYAFFINNIVLIPRKEETEIEKKAKEIYIITDKSTGYWLDKRKNENFEKDLTGNLIQTQLITSKWKSPVYYYDKNNNNKYEYILKKKMKRTAMEEYVNSDKIKKIIEIPNLNVKIENDNLVMKNLIKIDPNNVVVKTTKLENNVNIYNGDHYLYNHNILDKLNNDELTQLFEILLFRKIIGTNDTCERNIIYINNKLTSIDDPMLFKETEFMWKKPLNKELKSKYKGKLKNIFENIQDFIKNAELKIKESKELSKNEKDFMLKQLNIYNDLNNWKF